MDFPVSSNDKRICLHCRRPGFDPCVRKIPWKRAWQPTPVFLGESHGQRSLGGYGPWGLKQFTVPPTLQEGSFFSTPSPALVTCRLFDNGHSDWCEVIPLFCLIMSHLFIFAFILFFTLGRSQKKYCCNLCQSVFCLCSLLTIYHVEFIFVYGIRKCSNLIVLHVAIQIFQHHLLKGLSFLHCIFFSSLLKTNQPQMCGFISGLSILFH